MGEVERFWGPREGERGNRAFKLAHVYTEDEEEAWTVDDALVEFLRFLFEAVFEGSATLAAETRPTFSSSEFRVSQWVCLAVFLFSRDDAAVQLLAPAMAALLKGMHLLPHERMAVWSALTEARGVVASCARRLDAELENQERALPRVNLLTSAEVQRAFGSELAERRPTGAMWKAIACASSTRMRVMVSGARLISPTEMRPAPFACKVAVAPSPEEEPQVLLRRYPVYALAKTAMATKAPWEQLFARTSAPEVHAYAILASYMETLEWMRRVHGVAWRDLVAARHHDAPVSHYVQAWDSTAETKVTVDGVLASYAVLCDLLRSRFCESDAPRVSVYWHVVAAYVAAAGSAAAGRTLLLSLVGETLMHWLFSLPAEEPRAVLQKGAEVDRLVHLPAYIDRLGAANSDVLTGARAGPAARFAAYPSHAHAVGAFLASRSPRYVPLDIAWLVFDTIKRTRTNRRQHETLLSLIWNAAALHTEAIVSRPGVQWVRVSAADDDGALLGLLTAWLVEPMTPPALSCRVALALYSPWIETLGPHRAEGAAPRFCTVRASPCAPSSATTAWPRPPQAAAPASLVRLAACAELMSLMPRALHGHMVIPDARLPVISVDDAAAQVIGGAHLRTVLIPCTSLYAHAALAAFDAWPVAVSLARATEPCSAFLTLDRVAFVGSGAVTPFAKGVHCYALPAAPQFSRDPAESVAMDATDEWALKLLPDALANGSTLWAQTCAKENYDNATCGNCDACRALYAPETKKDRLRRLTSLDNVALADLVEQLDNNNKTSVGIIMRRSVSFSRS
jgi:hypothetical protein